MKETNFIITVMNKENGECDTLSLPLQPKEIPQIIKAKFGKFDRYENFEIKNIDTKLEIAEVKITSIVEINYLASMLSKMDDSVIERMLEYCKHTGINDPMELLNICASAPNIPFFTDFDDKELTEVVVEDIRQRVEILQEINTNTYNVQFAEAYYIDAKYEELIEGNCNNIDGVIGNNDSRYSLTALDGYKNELSGQSKQEEQSCTIDTMEREKI